MLWPLIITDLGFALAIVLFWELGALFRIPMLLNLAVSLFVNYSGILTDGIETAVFISLYGLLFILWVLLLSGLHRGMTGAFISFALVIVTIGVGMLTAANYDITKGWVNLSTLFIYIWTACIFLVILSVFIKSIITQMRKGYWSLLLTPKRRALIPIGVWSALICSSKLYEEALPQLYEIRFLIAAFCLGWGWVVIEFPHFMESWSQKQEETF